MKLPDGMSVAADFASMYPMTVKDVRYVSEGDLLEELTEEEAARREEVCKTCTWCNMAHCLKRYKIELKGRGSEGFWEQESALSKAKACNKYKMLVYGQCKKYMSIEQAEVQFAAEGV